MTFVDLQSSQRSVKLALAAGLLLAFLSAVSVLNVNVAGWRVGFGFVPLLVVLLWPRRANGPVSVAVVFLSGLFADWSMGGVVGQWALVYTVIFALLRAELRNEPFAFLRCFFAWLVAVGFVIILLFVSGHFVFGVLPDFGSLLRQAALGTAVLPFVLALRHWTARMAGATDDWSR